MAPKVAPAETVDDTKSKGKEEAKNDDDDDEKDDKSPEKDEKSETGTGTEGKKTKSRLTRRDQAKMKNGCQKCCGSIMMWCAHDAIYGVYYS